MESPSDSPISRSGAIHSPCYPGPVRPDLRLADLAGPVPRHNSRLERVKLNAVLRLGATAWRAVRPTVDLGGFAGIDEHDQIVTDISQTRSCIFTNTLYRDSTNNVTAFCYVNGHLMFVARKVPLADVHAFIDVRKLGASLNKSI